MSSPMTPTQALEALERVREALQAILVQQEYDNDRGKWGIRAVPSTGSLDKAKKALLELPAAISALKAMVGNAPTRDDTIDAFEAEYADTLVDLKHQSNDMAAGNGSVYEDRETDDMFGGFEDGYRLGFERARSPLRPSVEEVDDVEVSNVLHRFNLDRPDIAALPEGGSLVCNITTLRQAAALIKKLALRPAVDEAESALVDYFQQEISREFPNATTVPSREHHRLRAKPIIQALRPYLRPPVEQPEVGDIYHPDILEQWTGAGIDNLEIGKQYVVTGTHLQQIPVSKHSGEQKIQTVSREDSARVIYNSLMGKYDWEGGSEEAKATCTKVASAVIDSLKTQGVEISYVD